MKSHFKIAVATLAMCFASTTFAAESAPELQTEATLAQELNLSSQQVEQIKGLHDTALKNLSSVKLDSVGQDVILNMIKSGKWDEAAAKKQLQTISGIQAEARYYRAQYLFEVSKVLTAEQKAKLQQLMADSESMY